MKISEIASNIESGVTFTVNDICRTLASEGKTVFNLSVGEVSLPPHQAIKAAAIEAVQSNLAKYSFSMGDVDLRNVIIASIKKKYSKELNLNQVLVTCGVKTGLYTALRAICDPGDEVLVPTPYWGSYAQMIRLANSHIVPVESNADFSPNIPRIRDAITEKTAMILLNTPNNPTGYVYTRDEIEQIIQIAKERNIWVISDEIYEYMTYGDAEFISSLHVGDLQDNHIILSGISKHARVSGWRVGYAIGNSTIISRMCAIQTHVITSTSCISQHAAIKAIELGADAIKEHIPALQEARDYVCNYINEHVYGIHIDNKPQAGMFIFADCTQVCNELGIDDQQLALDLLHTSYVATVPGGAFLSNTYSNKSFIRIMFCHTDMEFLKNACIKIKEGIQSLLEKKAKQ